MATTNAPRSSAGAFIVRDAARGSVGLRRAGVALLLVSQWVGCEPALDVGSWRCGAAPLFIPPDGSPIVPGKDLPVTLEWSTSFEDGFCGYSNVMGFCYSDPDATYRLVDFPARSGRRAAAFDITTNATRSDAQARCVREGLLPEDAVYGAWFYIPAGTTNNGNWNLMHFRGGNDTGLHGMWDVSVATTEGVLRPFVRGFMGVGVLNAADDVTLPTDTWFSLQLRLRRDATPGGYVALYLNGELVVELSDVITDDSEWGQWYVGNLASNLNPPQSTIYVDDIAIRRGLDETF